ncbi:unnamed protein product [Larinioides sclopetarius]|uniref:Uncharacterized protein n=1 Tax=Larinioides sclopetarius TaxID=280406 RepID=A0AAV2AF13_9ARAC
MSERTTEYFKNFVTANSTLEKHSTRLTVSDKLSWKETLPSRPFNPNRLTVRDVQLELLDSTSKAKISRSLPLEFFNLSDDFFRTIDELHNTRLKRISRSAKSEQCPMMDSTGTSNKFRKLPLKRISGLSKSNFRIASYAKNLNDSFLTYDPYMPRPKSYANDSLVNLHEPEILSGFKLPNILSNDAAKLELQNSFVSAQRQDCLNWQGFLKLQLEWYEVWRWVSSSDVVFVIWQKFKVTNSVPK